MFVSGVSTVMNANIASDVRDISNDSIDEMLAL